MEVSGILLIDKPAGITSFGVVRKIKKWLRVKKIGHGGTLDPLATGVLPIFVNKATKIAQFFLDMDKKYVVTMRLGLETDTQDIEGNVVRATEDFNISLDMLKKEIGRFKGKIKQVPPPYSAVKVRGIPLYKWTRRGFKIDCPPREVEIYELNITHFQPPEVDFEVTCSKGTYIRTLCADIGKRLGCGACLARLRRLKTGPFSVDNAISLEFLHEAVKAKRWEDYLMNINQALAHLGAVVLDEKQEKQIKQGKFILWSDKLTNGLIRGLNKENELVAILRAKQIKNGVQLRPVRVFLTS
ncbi:MAG: tRNA pseudouridine(55) synthase TruB [Candidatus Desulfofervidaceae bacterium]|nr:tRNA pseudouridine(55) synthase TruB [Candidatus Desulfofervidaceae bacterium]MDL1969528.1 tRNA pseudouridine(55) synthase TruB [Candidatus Desulfofervidaceae bacterium]